MPLLSQIELSYGNTAAMKAGGSWIPRRGVESGVCGYTMESRWGKCAACFRRAPLDLRAVPWKLPLRAEEGQLKTHTSVHPWVCVSMKMYPTLRAFTLVGRRCRSSAVVYETLVWNSPGALTWKCSFAVTPVAALRMSEDNLRRSGGEVFP